MTLEEWKSLRSWQTIRDDNGKIWRVVNIFDPKKSKYLLGWKVILGYVPERIIQISEIYSVKNRQWVGNHTKFHLVNKNVTDSSGS